MNIQTNIYRARIAGNERNILAKDGHDAANMARSCMNMLDTKVPVQVAFVKSCDELTEEQYKHYYKMFSI